MGVDLTNHSYVDLTQVWNATDGNDSVQCHTDLSTCCHTDLGTYCNAAAGPDCGDWYFPNGTRLLFSGNRVNIFEGREAQ